jgi:steroid delta-isomerase-like uncharacterized protein
MRSFALSLLMGAILIASGSVQARVHTHALPAVAVGAQYDTTHVYVAPQDVDAFARSFVATFGGQSTKQVQATVTPTPSRTSSQLIQTPAGTVSVFGFTTPIPHPFGAERTGYLVTDLATAVASARAAGADILVDPFPDPIGRDAIIQWPGGVDMQLYWHTTRPSYAAFQTVPENRVYVSAVRADAFVKDFLRFSHGRIVSDDKTAPGVEIGRPGDTYRRIRLASTFGEMVVLVSDGHLPYPYGTEVSGYAVADLGTTLTKATNAGVSVLSGPYRADGRDAAVVQFPGGYVAEIHAPQAKGPLFMTPQTQLQTQAGPITHADIQTWADAWNSHDIATVMALFSPDIIIHQPSNPKPLDAAGIHDFFSMIFKAYPDFHVTVTDAVVDGLKGVSVEQVTGTWSGPYTDPATGKTTPGNGRTFDHPGVMVLTYQPDHKIKQVDIYWDRLMVNQQLGLMPQ